MQDIHPSNDGGGGGAGRVLDRRFRPHNHHHPTVALKCPRCDSLNTKFCYYNNYNLSQPRHFCKNCRRYWTKGGVLRNVPVGGGCRKSKRSVSTKKLKKSTHHSSSESSNSTAAIAAEITAIAAVEDTILLPNGVQNLDSEILFTTWDQKMTEDGLDMIDDLLQNKEDNNGGLASLDWQNDQGLFDHNQQSFWNQTTSSIEFNHFQWSDNSNFITSTNNDHPLFLP